MIDAPRKTLSLCDAYERSLCNWSARGPKSAAIQILTMINFTVVLEETYHRDHLPRKPVILRAPAASPLLGCDIVSLGVNLAL